MSMLSFVDSLNILTTGQDTFGTFDTAKIMAYPMLSEATLNSIGPYQNAGQLIPAANENWYFYFLMILIAGYALARAFLGQLLSSTFFSVLSYNNAASMFKDNSQLQRQRDIILYGYYFLSISFFIMLVAQHYSLNPSNLQSYDLFAIVTLIVVGYFVLRVVINNLLGVVFNNLGMFRENIYLGYSFNKLAGILLLPINFAILYTSGIFKEILILTGFAVILLMILMKIARGIQFSFRHDVFNFYLFLYLCALEIVPLLLIYKWLLTILKL